MFKRLSPNTFDRTYLRFALKGFVIEVRPNGKGFTVEAYLPRSMIQFAAWESNGTPEDTNELLGHLCGAILQLWNGEAFIEDVPFGSFVTPSVLDQGFRRYLATHFPIPEGVEYLTPFDLSFACMFHRGQLYADFETSTIREALRLGSTA